MMVTRPKGLELLVLYSLWPRAKENAVDAFLPQSSTSKTWLTSLANAVLLKHRG
jgi:hypothetical protein